MADSQFCLQWNHHNKNICHGLGSLQQSGEFVDMTLAADGHHVKVHQMVLALASPYIKDLIVAANCPHPVIFLNQVSYKTMCSLLEYIYMGETLVDVDNISELLVAAKQLHIKGLEDVKTDGVPTGATSTAADQQPIEIPDLQIKLLQPTTNPLSTPGPLKRKLDTRLKPLSNMPIQKKTMLSRVNESETIKTMTRSENDEPESDDCFNNDHGDDNDDPNVDVAATERPKDTLNMSLQYSVSKQGVLKLILNRYIYSMYYTSSDGSRRHWRCSHRSSKKFQCMAKVTTQGNVVVKRTFKHNHPFHDKMIMKLVQAGKIFGTLPDVEKQKEIGAEKPREADTTIHEKPGLQCLT